ncbi:MAG: hypothetical protein GC168_20595 [Candidatus Hydrogenedens sp.]|nr:hypothetical protein [Candidatus Hydrogenedens sp.]
MTPHHSPSSPSIALAVHAVEVLSVGADGATPAEWLQLLPLGTVTGRDGRGPYVIGDQAAAVAIVKASLAAVQSGEPPIDYDHASDFPQRGTAPAAGWIRALEARADGIWARVEWTAAAAAKLRAREYRFISPVFAHDEPPKKGEPARPLRIHAILRAGLTNNPNFDLPAAAQGASQAAASAEGDAMDPKKLAALLGLPETTPVADMETALTALVATHAADRARVTAVATALGKPATASAEELAAAAQGAAGAQPDPTKFVPMALHQATIEAFAAGKAAADQSAAETAVLAAMTAGQLTPALKPWGLGFAARDPAGFAAWAKTAPQIITTTVKSPPKATTAGTGALTPEQKSVASRLGLTAEQYQAAQQEGK